MANNTPVLKPPAGKSIRSAPPAAVAPVNAPIFTTGWVFAGNAAPQVGNTVLPRLSLIGANGCQAAPSQYCRTFTSSR